MNQKEKSALMVGICAVLGLLLIGALSFSEQSFIENSVMTGAVAGSSTPFKMCLFKNGKDIYGKWGWEKIQDCRDYYLALEKGGHAATPRLCLSSPERIECH